MSRSYEANVLPAKGQPSAKGHLSVLCPVERCGVEAKAYFNCMTTGTNCLAVLGFVSDVLSFCSNFIHCVA